MFAPGCQSTDAHDIPTAITPATVARYQIHSTPRQNTHESVPKAVAVAIDCEMGQAADGNPELIRVTLVEYFSGAVLLDTLVWPDTPMAHFNTRWSGVSAAQMNAARRNKTCLFGVDAARAAVWTWVNDQTVVVGHDVKNDLAALRWAHGVVVDSMVLEGDARKAPDAAAAEEGGKASSAIAARDGAFSAAPEADFAVGADDSKDKGKEGTKVDKPKAPGLNLKAVAKLLLDRDIQKGTHDSLEDALASRDIVHYRIVAGMA